MTKNTYQIAQINLARMLAPLDDPIMAGFVSRLPEINALADGSLGFVWRLQMEEGDATYLRPFDDDRIIANMSVWESIKHLKNFIYKSRHRELIKQREQWFEKLADMHMVMWWVQVGHIPSIAEAKRRLEHIRENGESPFAFTFKKIFQPEDCQEEDFSAVPLVPCSAI
jgi:hypothetical protein